MQVSKTYFISQLFFCTWNYLLAEAKTFFWTSHSQKKVHQYYLASCCHYCICL